MTFDPLLSRARYLVVVLPFFALVTTVHAGCNSGPNGLYYTTYGTHGNRVPSTADSPLSCVVHWTGSDGYGYEAPCDDDGYAYTDGDRP